MKRIQLVFAVAVFASLILSGCRSLNPSVMMKVNKDFKYSTFPSNPPVEYKLSPNDDIDINIFSNDGFKLVDITMLGNQTGTGGAGMGRGMKTEGSGLRFTIEFDGTVKLPLLGRTSLQGMTVREAETFLEDKYSSFYNKPYILVQVTNRRVIIYPGSEGSARVVPLAYENTTLMEALAMAGGIAKSGKAYNVKLIRGNLKNPEVYLIDLSTLEGVKQADLVLQANDIVYVEPQLRLSRDVMAEVLPYLSFITTMIVFFEFIKRKA